jgi:DsbC/DsbD-like thiol-disulfide interchange protein
MLTPYFTRMIKSRFRLVVFPAMLLVAAGCATAPNNGNTSTSATASPSVQRITSETVVKVAAQPVQIDAGSSSDAAVRITIQPGYHVNANPPTFSYLKATTLELPTSEGVSLGSVSYPKALQKKFAFAEKELAVYEGETELKAALKIDKTAPRGERSIPAQLRIQACDDQVCYPPGTIAFSIPVNIK